MLLAANVVIVVLALSVVPICVSVYVYRDAARRGMQPLLWALAAAFVPYLLGLVIYLLVRGKHSDLVCPRCGAGVRADFTVCPQCGQRLRPACPNCGCAVEADWKICPKCTAPLPETQPDVCPPVQRKDRSLWKVLLVALLIPALLVGFGIASLTLHSSSGSSSIISMEAEDYLGALAVQDPDHAPEIETWLRNARADSGAVHAIRYVNDTVPEKQVSCLIYVPNVGMDDSFDLELSSSLFSSKACLNFDRADGSGRVFLVMFSSRHTPRLQVRYGGQTHNCIITDAAFALPVV